MQISTILDHIDNGHMALPEFQRGYVWRRNQVRGLFESLYRRHPVGGLLVWATEAETTEHRGDGPVVAGIVKMLLDGQQRLTSLYGVIRGKPPKFFDGDERSFTKLRFHLEDEAFQFFQPVMMRDDPLWIDVTECMKAGHEGIGKLNAELSSNPDCDPAKISTYTGRLSRLLGIKDIVLHIEEVTGGDKTLDVVVDIFNQLNSGGTKLSKGDLALAKICTRWPEARDTMKAKLKEWSDKGYQFKLDWLLRSINMIMTGEAKFSYLHDKSAEDFKENLARATKYADKSLNIIANRLGLDHDRVLFGRGGIPLMVFYINSKNGELGAKEQDKLLFWYAQAGMWGRFSASSETRLDEDLAALEGSDGDVDSLIKQLRRSRGSLVVEAEDFTSWGLAARFYPVLYMLTRMGGARDWGNGLKIEGNMLGRTSRLECHHIFPKSQLRKREFKKEEINALANFCFQTQGTNLDISDRLPEEYFPEIKDRHPGTLESQWIPMDPALWKIDRYIDFLKARKELLAKEANSRFEELLHGDTHLLSSEEKASIDISPAPLGGIASEEEEIELGKLNDWVEEKGLECGQIAFEYVDSETGVQKAIFDLAWPDGIKPGLTRPVALLLNEKSDLLAVASESDFQCFTETEKLKSYIESEILP